MDLNNLGTLNQERDSTAAASANRTGVTPNAPTDQRFSIPDPIAAANAADVYHGPGDPASPNLLTQRGVGAYLQLLNALAGDELHEKSADLLTTSLRSASATLKLSYHEAVSRLPPGLVSKDWGFSVSNDKLIFIPHQDELSTQDLTDLSHAFTRSNVESAAKQVATVIASIAQMRNAGADSRSLAWTRLDVDVEAANSGDRVDLRSFVTTTAPGSLYHPNTAPVSHSQIPPMLGGMDFRELVTARPRFLRADGSVSPEALDEYDVPHEAPQICTLHGQCACSQVRFLVQDVFEYAFYCHCSRCRVRTGSAFAAIAGISIDKVEVTAGHEHLLLEGECSDGYGARCRRCFSFLFAAVRERKYLHISLGSLVDTPSRVPDHHIHVASKAPWYQITDALPQYPESP
jgi:hypothetical protein